MTLYGEQIGKKFEPDGSPRWYPGNTVIADVTACSSGYAAMTRVRGNGAGVRHRGYPLILLPEDSYHMTVLRGLNDQVRTDAFWPAALPKDAPMTAVDDYVSRAVARVPMPGPARMRFAGVRADVADFRVLLAPADEAQAQALQRFRDLAAASTPVSARHAKYGYISRWRIYARLRRAFRRGAWRRCCPIWKTSSSRSRRLRPRSAYSLL